MPTTCMHWNSLTRLWLEIWLWLTCMTWALVVSMLVLLLYIVPWSQKNIADSIAKHIWVWLGLHEFQESKSQCTWEGCHWRCCLVWPCWATESWLHHSPCVCAAFWVWHCWSNHLHACPDSEVHKQGQLRLWRFWPPCFCSHCKHSESMHLGKEQWHHNCFNVTYWNTKNDYIYIWNM